MKSFISKLAALPLLMTLSAIALSADLKAASNFQQDKENICSSEWTKRGVSDATIIMFCLKNELEGVRDYQYYKEQHDSAAVDRIAPQALHTFKSWSMVAYQIEQEFD